MPFAVVASVPSTDLLLDTVQGMVGSLSAPVPWVVLFMDTALAAFPRRGWECC